ncbi:serine/threonine-protein phosphatase PGAM5, mitochondrial-like isoform X2 [Acanthaster planci]|uniref:Serine/threonine-protein phosphatase PGAM5, mitochondrial n=1 Tax=Acanthaster planci TaxID=133434 RepID=A0A8B7Z8I3_ACAPL|nr:serine/threonine-protein phosphatase PGAM5, mitochondrial-like isoform X2 [Acanthaster planci]
MSGGFRYCLRVGKMVLCGVTTGVAAAAVVYKTSEGKDELLPTAHASWTTNYTPSCKWEGNWDRRDPGSLLSPNKTELDGSELSGQIQKLKPTATRHLILIRHGQYDMDGETDEKRILSAQGKEQAELTGKRLKELDHPYTLMIHSSMTRAKETADIIAKSIPQVPRGVCDMLREGAPIPPEPPVGHWKPELKFYEDGARIEAAFRKYFHRADPDQVKDSYEILVCHANVIRYFVCRAMQFPPEAWLRISLNHGSITWLAIRPSGRVSLRQLGDCGHMPASKISST